MRWSPLNRGGHSKDKAHFMAETVLSILSDTLAASPTHALVGRALLSWSRPARTMDHLRACWRKRTEPVIAPLRRVVPRSARSISLSIVAIDSHPGAGAVAATGTVVAHLKYMNVPAESDFLRRVFM